MDASQVGLEIKKQAKQISDAVYEVPTSAKSGMLVPARLYATPALFKEMDPGVFAQITNVACLPGIQKAALAMPDAHWGYGFPIGGVAATDPKEGGVISPGGIGFDINCGMKMIRTDLTWKEVKPKIKELVDTLFKTVPAGVGSQYTVKLTASQFQEVMTQGTQWAVKQGYGWKDDVDHTENYGKIAWADPSKVSERALKRGREQLGTLGSGNHYLEIQVAHKENVHEEEIAKAWGIDRDEQIVIMFHCGSRGFGHQIATDYLKIFNDAMPKYGIKVEDRELACAPFESKEGQDYYAAMACGANFGFANRQLILHSIREAFAKVFGRTAEDLGMKLIYDVAHNMAKLEKYKIDGRTRQLVVHRKGATRAFGPANEELAPVYKKTGQPVILGGSMETGSYLLVGTKKAEEETFGSTAHGSGRTMSRTEAKRKVRGDELQKDMLKRGIYVRSASMPGLAEEAGFAYKEISTVVETMAKAGITKPVVALKPVGNVKG